MKTSEQSERPIPANPPALAPARRFTPHYGRDELGFLDPGRSSSLLDAKGLLEHPAVLIKAQPWMGKTTFARQTHAWLAEDPEKKERFGSFCELTCFEESINVLQLLPGWWIEWKSLRPARPACWIIDGLDECELDHLGIPQWIAREIAELPAKSHRSNLRLIILSRDRDWLQEFEDKLHPLYAELGSDGLLVLRMAPLDHDEATRMLGSRSAFDRVTDIIERYDGLAAIAGYPRVLKFLGEWKEEGPLSPANVWEAILKDLLEEHTRVKDRRFSTELEHRFEAVARIAAVSMLSGQHALYFSGGQSNSPGLTLGNVFPLTPRADRAEQMREAARESIRIGGPFRSSIEGGILFGQRNIRDWFCAFGLRDIERERLDPMVADDHGPLPSLVDMLRLLRQVSREPDVRSWLTSLLASLGPTSSDAPWGLEDALRQLDHLEKIASQSPSSLYLHDDEQLKRLEAPGLAKQIASRLKDSNRAASVRKLLLDIAWALKMPEAVAPAMEIVLDETQDIRLREWAAILVRKLGTAIDAARLDGPIARSRGNSDDERSFLAQVILTLLVHGVWSVHQAFLCAPRENPQVTDTTSFLIYEMEKRVTADDARLIISGYLDLKRRAKTRKAKEQSAFSDRQKKLRAACIRKLVEEPRLSRTDQAMLARLSVRLFADPDEDDLDGLILQRLRQHAYGRRWLYHFFVSNVIKGNPRPPYNLRRMLTREDLRWLLGRAESKWDSIREVWADLYFLTTASPEPGDDDSVDRVLAAIARHAPTIPEEFEKTKRECERQEREIEEKRRRRRGSVKRHAIAEVVDQVLQREDLTDIDRLRKLSLLCFSGAVWRYQDVDGNWGDLDLEHQHRVVETCRNGLKEGTPTSFPDDKTFTPWNLAEAQAFVAALENSPPDDWLDGRMIVKWLPTVLRTHVPNALETMIACAGKDHSATTAVVVAMIESELNGGEGPMVLANSVPTELWPGVVAQRVADFAQDESLGPARRAGLLELLAANASSSALPLALAWTEKYECEDGATLLYRKALDVRLALDPQGAWPLIEAAFRKRGGDVLQDLSSLWQRHGDFVDFSQWPTAQLGRLALMLIETFPLPNEGEHRPDGWVMMGTDEALREVRDRVISMLIQRQLDEDSHSLAPLFEVEPRLNERFEWEKQQREALQLLGNLGQDQTSGTSLPTMAGIPVEQVVRVLDEADYRLIRSGDDLLKALVHVLRQVGEGAPYDLSMLYGRNETEESGGKIKKKPGTKGVRRRLEEDALQAYVRRRLDDLLPSRIPGIQVNAYREPEVKYRRRFDLDVVAPTIDRQLVRVIIEIKWSDNADTKSNLEKQLVRDYLLSHNLSHGIYLVGWNGDWKERGTKGKNIQELMAYLSEQVRSVTASEEGKSLKVEPVILDLRWRDDLPE